jgi:Rho GTPase-activating protein 1
MCSFPGGPSPLSGQKTSSQDTTTTLGMVVKLCIQRYYEIFDEVRDVSEAVEPIFQDVTQHSIGEVDPLPSMAGPSTSGATSPPQAQSIANSSRPPSAWNKAAATNGGRPRLRPRPSLKVVNDNDDNPSTRSNGSNGTWSMPRSRRSILSIEKAPGGKPGTGSITLGKPVPTIGRAGGQNSTGTVRKSAGATVTAVGVTATGFFAPALGTEGGNGNGEGGVDDRPGAGFEALKKRQRPHVRNSFVGAFEEHRS